MSYLPSQETPDPLLHQQRARLTEEAEARFRQLTDAIPQIIWITDAAGQVVYFNAPWRRYTGLQYDPDNAAEVAAATVHPDDVPITMERFQRAMETGGPFDVEHRIRSASGAYRWFLVRGRPSRDPVSGAILRWFGVSVDIDDQKQAQAALQGFAARQSFQLELVERLRHAHDASDCIERACALLGERLRADRVVYGEMDAAQEWMAPTGDWTRADSPVRPKERRLRLDAFGDVAAQQLRSGRPVVADDAGAAASLAGHADGAGALLLVPLKSADQQLKTVLAVSRRTPQSWSELDIAIAADMVARTADAAEKIQSETNLRIERDRNQSVLDAMTEGFALLDSDWTVLQMNEAGLRIGHRSGQQVIGRNHWEVWPEARGTMAEERYRRVMTSAVPEAWEYLQPFDNAPAAWIEVRAYPAGNGNLAVFFRDITERKAVEQQLQEADRRKDEFLAMLAHELRNPLAPIGAASQLLQMGKLDDGLVRQTSQIIARQVNHMTHLIDDLLDVSRVTRGLVQLEKEALDIRRIVVDSVEQATPLIQARGHHLSLHLPPTPITVLGDKKRLVQVLVNILNNAAKYTNQGGAIVLTAQLHGDTVELDVRDNGIGMTAELAAHAFDLFSQADRSVDRSAGGLGLGLALAKNLVELHGGSVRCRSDGPGQGSTFCICLPCLHTSDRPGEQTAAADQPAAALAAAPALHILVVDDNADAAQMMAMLLESLGHRVTTAYGSLEALALAAADAPDVCLLDIGLPEMDGHELARQLRKRPATATATLIAVTGYGQDDDRRRTLAAGFDHHLVKPVDLHALAEMLSKIALRA